MAEIKNEQQSNSFKRKLGNTTYTVKMHFSKDTDKTFKICKAREKTDDTHRGRNKAYLSSPRCGKISKTYC